MQLGGGGARGRVFAKIADVPRQPFWGQQNQDGRRPFHFTHAHPSPGRPVSIASLLSNKRAC